MRPTENQIDDLLDETRGVVDRGARVLVTTLTKRMAEDLTDYLDSSGIRVRYLHSDIDALQRKELLPGNRSLIQTGSRIARNVETEIMYTYTRTCYFSRK